MRNFAVVLVLFTAGVAAGAESRPHLVVLVVVDTLRADHVGVYGYDRPTTPDLDRLFREGSLLYTQSYAAAAYTQPSKTSMMTGQRPSRHGYTGYQSGSGSIAVNLVAFFKSKGYYTFSSNANPNTPWIDTLYDEFWATQWKKDGTYRYYPADKVIDEAKKGIAKANGRDVFLFLQFADPHLPYDPPDYDPAFFEHDAIGKNFDPKFDGIRSVRVKDLTPPVLANMRNRYDASIRYIDKQLAPFLRSLQETWPEHVIIFTSDHGEAFLEHGEAGHSTAMYNTVIRVPLVVIDSRRWKGSLHKCEALVSGLDLFPTLIERLGGDPGKERLDGRSFAWTFDSTTPRRDARVSVSESPYFTDTMTSFGQCWGMAYFYQPRWGDAHGTLAKLTTYGPDCSKLRYSVIHRDQWFDAETDVDQKNQLRPRQARAGVVDPVFTAAWSLPAINASAPKSLTPEEIKTLKALGYLQ
jgi:arylsulfatase A-like enzyme